MWPPDGVRKRRRDRTVGLTALQIGQDAGQPDAFVWFAPQLFFARVAQGRLAEILDLVRQQIADNPGLPAWRCRVGGDPRSNRRARRGGRAGAEMMVDSSSVFPRTTRFGCSATRPWEKPWRPWARPSRLPKSMPVCARTPGSHSLRRSLHHDVGQSRACSPIWRLAQVEPNLAVDHFARAKEEHERLGAPEWVARTSSNGAASLTPVNQIAP